MTNLLILDLIFCHSQSVIRQCLEFICRLVNSQMKQRAFTTIEILGIIFAICAFGAIIAFGLSIIKKEAADSKRITEMKSLANSLEDYYDKHAEYPSRLESLVSGGFLRYVPTPAPYGGTVRKYIYVPLGENSICTGFHLGVPLETTFADALGKDADAKVGIPCSGAQGDDFDGRAMNCEPGQAGAGERENCYDLKI